MSRDGTKGGVMSDYTCGDCGADLCPDCGLCTGQDGGCECGTTNGVNFCPGYNAAMCAYCGGFKDDPCDEVCDEVVALCQERGDVGLYGLTPDDVIYSLEGA
jgi:hypothetical protein